MTNNFRIGDKVKCTDEMGDVSHGFVTHYAVNDEDGTPMVWCDTVGYGVQLWPQDAVSKV